MDIERLIKYNLEILNHYGKKYQCNRIHLEESELNKAINNMKENDLKKHLQSFEKEEFEIKDTSVLLNSLIDEVADVVIMSSQIDDCFYIFDRYYESVIFQYNLQNYDSNKKFKECVFERIKYKIERQIERIRNEKL